MEDWDCLRHFVEKGSQEAFERLVCRYVDLVFSAAIRQVRDPHLAEDVTQNTFIALSKKARSLRPAPSLAGWLLVTTRFIALDTLKIEARRKRREREAAMPEAQLDEPAPDPWQTMHDHLDAALASLGGKDREAIALRYFQNKSFKEVGEALGLSVDAARQRVHRATDRMRAFFVRRGALVPADIIGPMILANAVQQAPPGLASAASKAVCAASLSAAGAFSGKGMVITMASAQTKITVTAAALALLAGGAFVGYKAIAPTSPRTLVLVPQQRINSPGEASWKARFLSAYQLAPGQILKLVSPPSPERQEYWKHWNDAMHTPPPPLGPDAGLTLIADQTDLHFRTISMTPGTNYLGNVLTAAGLRNWELDRSIPVSMRFSGDWVIGNGGSLQQFMNTLAGIVSQRLGRQVRFVQRKAPREAIVAKGRFAFVPLAGHLNDKTLWLTDGHKPERAFIMGGQLRQLFDQVSVIESLPLVDETGSGNAHLRFPQVLPNQNADALLRSITAQTSIRFDREPRPIDVWFMVDSNGTTVPVDPR